MKIDEKFNRRSAQLVDVQMPSVHVGYRFALGIKLSFHRTPGDGSDLSTLGMHLMRDEALEMASLLINAARNA